MPLERASLAEAMQLHGELEEPIPAAAWRWIDTFIEAFGAQAPDVESALPEVAALRAESAIVPALALERLRNRQVVFFLDAVSQYVDAQAELRGLPLDHDLGAIADEFGIVHDDARWAVRVALTGREQGPDLGLLFVLLGHDRILMRIGAISSHLLHGRGLQPLAFGPGGEPFRTIEPHQPSTARRCDA
ncbi:MAG: hypothetical protein WCE44_05925 [Candidatus Velthaea sp.]